MSPTSVPARPGPSKRTRACYVYMILCADRTLYTGSAVDVRRRVRQHEEGRGAKYTRGRAPVRLVYVRRCRSWSEALRRERRIKALTRSQKDRLVAGAPARPC